jgi:hypothetical protein
MAIPDFITFPYKFSFLNFYSSVCKLKSFMDIFFYQKFSYRLSVQYVFCDTVLGVASKKVNFVSSCMYAKNQTGQAQQVW